MNVVKLSAFIWLATATSFTNADICMGENNTFTFKVDLHAGELGYYTVEECGDMPNPTLGMVIGETYTFYQLDRSNYYHPVGFAYEADGAHADVDELEPGISRGSSACADDLSCPAPMYFVDGEYVGEYSNIPEVTAVTGSDNFGLDDYEPLFFYPLPDWAGFGEFSVQLRFDDDTFGSDIFYFCHIHQFMTGRIKLLDAAGEKVQEADEPEIPYEYDQPLGFNARCGTFLLNDFTLPNDQCPTEFVCGADEVGSEEYSQFASCIDAMNCHMMAGMTTGSSSGSEVALFIHQMIPHHQNAVNMAKALLRTGKLVCDDITDETADCAMEQIIREIINTQNFQIQGMRAYLDEMGLPAEDDCTVTVTSDNDMTPTAPSTPVASPPTMDTTSGARRSLSLFNFLV